LLLYIAGRERKNNIMVLNRKGQETRALNPEPSNLGCRITVRLSDVEPADRVWSKKHY